jgi:methyl-accepting chemotaxis protein
MRKKILYTLVLSFFGIIALSVDYHFEKKRAYKEVMLSEQNIFDEKAAQLENAFQQIYQGARTISLLPTMRTLTGGNLPKGYIETKKYDTARLPSDAQMTVQQIYNNLINNISASEIYAILKGFQPEKGETPFFMFDKMVLDTTSTPEPEPAKTSDTPEQSEEAEYSYYVGELHNFQTKFPNFDIQKNGINAIPMSVSSMMRTCDNAQFISKTKGNVTDSQGLLFNVPFFKRGSGEFLGMISVVIRTNVFEAMLLSVPYLIITPEDEANAKQAGFVMPLDPARFVLSSSEQNISIYDRRWSKDFTKESEGIISKKLKVSSTNSWELLYSVSPIVLSKSSRTVLFTFLTKLFGVLLLAGMLIAFFIYSEKQALERAKIIDEAMKSFNMLEKFPINIMTASKDGIFTYMNENSKTTLSKLQQYLPEKVENFIGKSIDMLHKNPEVQQRIISDPKNLPHKALIKVGPETLDLNVVAIIDIDGNYVGPMVTWSIATERVNLVRDLTTSSADLANASSNVMAISSNLSSAAEQTSAQANTASVASEEVNAGVQTVASNMGEMVSAIKEITKTTNEAASMTNEAMRLAKNTNLIINKLGESSMDIGNVIKVISSIAQQTNLLALNATIEAARAGEAGKGFAVVANEVKELANQTAKATNEITKKIETIQTDSQSAVEAIAEISHAIEKVNGFTGNIAASVEEQAATTNEVTRIVSEAAEGVKQINENISQVSEAAASTGKDAGNVQVAAKSVGEIAELLKKLVANLRV